MIVLGLTGSIGMGKSTASAMFRDRGIPVFDADEVVHDLYRGAAAPLVEAAFPGTTVDGAVDRAKLGAAVVGKPEKLALLESIVHPLVREAERAFLDAAERSGAQLAVLDIPLLLEGSGAERCDLIAVVSAGPEIQRERVLGREGMTEEKFAGILARQMPDEQKRALADIIIDTSSDIESTRRTVDGIIVRLTTGESA
jgi:dephospho-CoA kinase